MSERVTIRVQGNYGSISDLVWSGVPPFAVLTGVNGAGKSQLLEVIAASYNALLRPRDGFGSPPRIEARAALWSGEHPTDIRTTEVLHAYDEWVPQSTGEVTEEEIRLLIRELHGLGLADTRSMMTTSAAEMFGKLVDLGVPLEGREPTLSDLYEKLTPRLLWEYVSMKGPPSLALLFFSYRLFEREALGRRDSESEVRDRFGEPPWELLDEILESSGLPFRSIHPEPAEPTTLFREQSFALRLWDTERGVAIPFDELSSGEKVIVSTLIWRYVAEQDARHPKLLLLDEPDAHLHPSLTRRFLNVIQEVFVKQRGVRVIMTTHSPSTVALVPEDSLFEMRRTEPRIAPAPDKERLIAVLTDGFVAVQEATQTVFVEGKEDPPFYGQVWELLTERSAIAEPGPLEPYPNVSFVHGKGKETVETLVPQMRDGGMSSFHGIIDRDTSNTPSEGVRVLARNGMENYLYDPLNVWAFLHSQDRASDVDSGVDVPRGGSSRIRDLPEEDLQRIADAVLAKVEGKMVGLTTDEKNLEEIGHVNGKRLNYPRWFLYRDDKEVKDAFVQAFRQHVLKPHRLDELRRSYATLNMIPSDLLDTLRDIQASGKPRPHPAPGTSS